jgi:hypothetical protein
MLGSATYPLAMLEGLSGCTDCSRLAQFLAAVRSQYPHYRPLPVPLFGDDNARLLIVGLAPGMHGANRTGRADPGSNSGQVGKLQEHQEWPGESQARQPGKDTQGAIPQEQPRGDVAGDGNEVSERRGPFS